MRCGLLPYWEKDEKLSYSTFKARPTPIERTSSRPLPPLPVWQFPAASGSRSGARGRRSCGRPNRVVPAVGAHIPERHAIKPQIATPLKYKRFMARSRGIVLIEPID